MANKNLPYYLGFSHCFGIGPVKFEALISHFQDVEKAYNASFDELKTVIGANFAHQFVTFRKIFDPVKKLQEITNKGINILTQEDELFPDALKNISDVPICLYIKGKIGNINFDKDFFFAIVGTRKPTYYGEQVAKKFATELVDVGFIIVSGMALGIDTIAHKVALEEGGKTIAFLGCGVDICYPASNYQLYQKIINTGGLVISEFPPEQRVSKGLFVARNRLISGLSRGVLVVEGTKESGALITARAAANQGKDVFAPPAPLTSTLSEAPNMLLKQGAKLVTKVEDILEEFNLNISPKKSEQILATLSEEEKIIFSELIKEPKLADDLALLLTCDISKALYILSGLEVKGVVKKNKEGKFEVLFI